MARLTINPRQKRSNSMALELAKDRIKYEGRICFGLEFFDTEARAIERGEEIAAAGHTYNGGFYHGRTCGREPQFDYTDPKTGKRLFAVSR